MGIKTFQTGDGVEVSILGNFAPLTRGVPENHDFVEDEYKAVVPFKFKWRDRVGKVECTCTEVIESYMPYYGFHWQHTDGCALMRLVKEKPQLLNLHCYQHLPDIAFSE